MKLRCLFDGHLWETYRHNHWMSVNEKQTEQPFTVSRLAELSCVWCGKKISVSWRNELFTSDTIKGLYVDSVSLQT